MKLRLSSIIPFIVAMLFTLGTVVLAENLEDTADKLLDQGRWEEALKMYSSLKAKDSTDEARLCLSKAICYGHLGQFDKKLANCNKALSIDPENITYLIARSDCYVHLGEGKKALEDCNKGLALDPTESSLYCNRGEAQYLMGNFEQAIADLSKAIEMVPNFGEAFHYRGLANAKAGKNKEADSDNQKAKELGYTPGSSSLMDGDVQNQLNKQ